MANTTNTQQALKQRGSRLIMIGSSLAALTAILAISIELMGWRGGDLTVLDGVDVPGLISSFYAPEGFSSTEMEMRSAVDVVTKTVFYLCVPLVFVIAFISFLRGHFSPVSLFMPIAFAVLPMTMLGFFPETPESAESSAFSTAIEEHNYEAVKEQLMLTPMATSQEVLYVLAQVAVIGQHSQAPTVSASFLDARSNADDPIDVPEQRRYALEVAAHGQAVTVEGHAFLAKQLRNRTVATAALYGFCLIALFSVGTMLLGMNIRRRAVRLRQLSTELVKS